MCNFSSARRSVTSRPLKWRETREYWDDAKSAEFERKYMDELQASVDTAVIVIEKLDKLLAKIKKDCE